MGSFWASFSGMVEKARIEPGLKREHRFQGFEGSFFDVFFDAFSMRSRGRLFIDFDGFWDPFGVQNGWKI